MATLCLGDAFAAVLRQSCCRWRLNGALSLPQLPSTPSIHPRCPTHAIFPSALTASALPPEATSGHLQHLAPQLRGRVGVCWCG
jgi:hypothetical protein